MITWNGICAYEGHFASDGHLPFLMIGIVVASQDLSQDHVDALRTGALSDGIHVSVVVPTCRRPQLLERCLNSLVHQTLDGRAYEIVIVDDAPHEDTRAVAERWAPRAFQRGLRVAYLPSGGPHGPAAARNHGWRIARGDIIAFTDDDTIASPEWLVNGLRAMGNDLHAVRGRIVMPMTGAPTDYELDAKNMETAEFVTANCFCRRQVLQQLHGFDERFRLAWREDSDLHFRLLDCGALIGHAPSAVVTHPIRPARWGISLSQARKIQFDALLFKKHPLRYREKIRATPRWDYYLIVASLLCWLGALATAHYGVTAIAAVLWLVMTARFCAQRLRRTSRSPAHVAEMLLTSILIPPVAVFWRAVGAVRFRAGLL